MLLLQYHSLLEYEPCGNKNTCILSITQTLRKQKMCFVKQTLQIQKMCFVNYTNPVEKKRCVLSITQTLWKQKDVFCQLPKPWGIKKMCFVNETNPVDSYCEVVAKRYICMQKYSIWQFVPLNTQMTNNVKEIFTSLRTWVSIPGGSEWISSSEIHVFYELRMWHIIYYMY
jgi:hypothetical protein